MSGVSLCWSCSRATVTSCFKIVWLEMEIELASDKDCPTGSVNNTKSLFDYWDWHFKWQNTPRETFTILNPPQGAADFCWRFYKLQDGPVYSCFSQKCFLSISWLFFIVLILKCCPWECFGGGNDFITSLGGLHSSASWHYWQISI